MSDQKVDKLFNSKLESLEVKPSPGAWGTLESELSGKQRKVLFWRLAVAATILLVFSIGFLLWDRGASINETPLTETMDKEIPVTKIPSETEKANLADATEVPEVENETKIETSVPETVKLSGTEVEAKEIQARKTFLVLEENNNQESEVQEELIEVPVPEILENAVALEEHEEPVKRELPPITIEYRSGAVAQNQPEPEKKKGIVKKIRHLAKEVKDSDINLGSLREAKDDFLAFDKKKEKKEEKNN